VHLKTLSLAGFKSFADRTRIECEPGVTVVVGPNGSGKSNIVDAIAWVMGTQATSTLRTEKMEDVIFAGTAVRPALGRAEVSLTLDNGSGRLSIDLAEVTITRRLFRDGTSEYEINGTSCRLLDIQEMLGDSGVGRHQHVLVGQGRVEGVLNAGPEEHRAIIEEAAGVIKHRQRRDRSIRRLEATDIDIERLQDLLTEQHRLMRPLKRQAAAAQQHDTVKAEWRALRLWLGGERLRTVRDRLAELRVRDTTTRTELDTAVAEREQITASLGGLQAAAGQRGEALDRDTSAAARLETAAERLQRIALVARERRLGLERRMAGATERKTDLTSEREHLVAQIEAARAEEASASEAAETLAITLRALEDEERSLADTDRLSADGVAASLQGDLAALEAAAVRDDRESADLARRRGVVAAVVEEESTEAERLATERVAVLADLEAAQKAFSGARDRLGADQDQVAAVEESLRLSERSVAAAMARVEALEAVRAGLADPQTRSVASSAPGIVGSITARLDVPPDLARAVDAALGAWADAFVAADHDRVVGAAGIIKDAGRGGVSFVAPRAGQGVPARVAAADRHGVDALVDLLGPAADLALAATVVGDVVLAKSWTAAAELIVAHPGVRAVTLDGDLVTAAGIVAGHPEGAGPAVIEAARSVAERAEVERARAASRMATATRGRETSRRAADEAEVRFEAARRKAAGIDETISLLDRSMTERRAELERLDARSRGLAEAGATRVERVSGLRARLAAMEGDIAAGAALWENLARRREEVARRRGEVQHRRQESTSAAAAAAERRQLMESRLAELTTLFDVEVEPVDPSLLERLTSVERNAVRARAAVRSHIDALRERQRGLRSEVGEAGQRLEAARRRRDALGDEIEQAREVASSLAVEQAELRVREESVAEALRRDVDADEDTALVAPRPEIDETASPDELLASLEAKLKRLGPINPLAATEYKELEERSGFLEAQLTDLTESRDELRKVISVLDEEIGRLFVVAFEEIAANFSENFSILFPGGTGKITLSDPDHPLTTGVDIFAQPMGKKVDRLQLLSGGERSLAALAFLFAVFRSRPSPFYVLDEVEAALDDANLHRFLRLVATLRDTSQLLIVTHQQQTMEVADVLYGVTMEPGESSRVIAKRMSEVGATA
jgi:chromosome segregation protein